MGSAAGARQGRIVQRHDAIRDLLANTLNALEEVTVVSTEPTLDGEGGHGQRGDIKLLANGTEFPPQPTDPICEIASLLGKWRRLNGN